MKALKTLLALGVAMAVSATSFAQTTQPTAAEQMNAVKASVAEKASAAKEATKEKAAELKAGSAEKWRQQKPKPNQSKIPPKIKWTQ